MIDRQATLCVEWTGARTSRGYGAKWHEGRLWLAHRLVMLQHHVPIAGLFVMHRCDNPPCINPDHLTVGTHADNMADCTSKGRWPRGEKHHTSKLSDAQWDEIGRRYAAGESQGSLSREYGINQSQISRRIAR
jgi:hypothetical protein